MKRYLMGAGFGVMVCLMAVWPSTTVAQNGFESVTGDEFVKAVPGDFYLEGNRIPVEKRNAVLLKTAKGSRVVVALIDTSGYSSQIKQKYTGMLITETRISVCRKKLRVGSYGFGLDRPDATSNADASFKIYNQAGERLCACAARKDDGIKQPKPLSVTADNSDPAKLYLGKYVIEIK